MSVQGFADSSEASAGGRSIRLTARGQPGEINFDVAIRVPPNDALSGGQIGVGNVPATAFRLENVSNVRNDISSTAGDLFGPIQQLPSSAVQQILPLGITRPDTVPDVINNNIDILNGLSLSSPVLDSNISFSPSQPSNLEVTRGVQVSDSIREVPISVPGGPLRNDVAITYSLRLTFPVMTLPRLSNGRIQDWFEQQIPFDPTTVLDNLPSLQIEHGVQSTESIFFGFGGVPEMFTGVDIPGGLFVRTEPVSLSCNNIYSDIQADIAVVQDRAQSAVNNAQQIIDNLIGPQGLRTQIQNTFGFDQIPDSLDDVNIRQTIQNLDQTQITEWRNRLQEMNLNPVPDNQQLGSPADSLQENTLFARFNELQNRVSDAIQPCRQQFNISQIENNLLQAQEIINRATNIRSNLSSFIDDIESRFGGVPCADEFSALASDISDIESRVSNLRDVTGGGTPSRNQVQNILSDTRSIQNRIDDIERPGCVDQFTSRLQSLRNTLTGMIEAELNCADVVPQTLRARVNSFTADAREFSRLSEIERSQQQFSNLQNRSESLISDIQNQVQEPECIEQLTGDVESALTGLEATGPARPEIITCGQQYPDIDDAVSNFENRVADLQAPIDAATQQDISRSGLDLINTIQNDVDPGRCRADFVSRVRSASDRLQTLRESVRVTVIEDQQEEAEETLNQLLEQIQQIQVRGVPNPRQERDELL